ncbi:MAG: tRNA (adenosine(37)-N6)-dimethylallyltransferase MiaA [Prevotella sp.]
MYSLIVVTGPTAVGKTDLCATLAEHYSVPIINADSRQIFSEMEIGTATPDRELTERIRHYKVAELHLGEYYNASMYEQDVMEIMSDLSQAAIHNNTASPLPIAILTGGSMMYIDAVCNGIDDIPTIDSSLREQIQEKLDREGLEAIYKELETLDPEYSRIVDKKNVRRVVHGLEVCLQSGKPYSSFRNNTKKERPFHIIKIGLTLPRNELYERINLRVDRMMQTGLLEEARRLYPYRHFNSLNTVGYKELFAYFDGDYSMEEAVERIKGNTRKYARKQLTWFKRDPSIRWFSPFDKEGIIQHINTLCHGSNNNGQA